MRRHEWKDPSLVNENVKLTISECDGRLCHFAAAGCVSTIRGYEICFRSCAPNFFGGLVPAIRISPRKQRINAKLSHYSRRAKPFPLVPPAIRAVAIRSVMCDFLGEWNSLRALARLPIRHP
jgi:hypothetical protein